MVLAFLGDTRVGCVSIRRKPPEEERVGKGSDGGEGGVGGPGPPGVYFLCIFLFSRGGSRGGNYFPLFRLPIFSFPLLLTLGL